MSNPGSATLQTLKIDDQFRQTVNQSSDNKFGVITLLYTLVYIVLNFLLPGMFFDQPDVWVQI
jgi:hypothetical protein